MEVFQPSKRLGKIGEFVPVFSGTFTWHVKRSESEEEELRMKNQATLARWLESATARRLLGGGQSEKTKALDGGTRVRRKEKDSVMELQMHEEHRVIKLTDVEILPNAGKTILGTLEAHVNGFIYTASNFRMVFMHANLEMFFMRLGDEMMPPLLQFHLEHSVTKDIQFCLVPSPLGQVRYEKDKQISNNSRNEDLKNFVQKVQQEPQSWGSRLPIHFDDLEEFKFCGAFPNGASVTCALTYFALVMLEETPFVVVPLLAIEIVNLAQLGPETVDMTVVFQYIKRDVLEIRLVPLKFLTGIKHRLNFGGVKYYVNC